MERRRGEKKSCFRLVGKIVNEASFAVKFFKGPLFVVADKPCFEGFLFIGAAVFVTLIMRDGFLADLETSSEQVATFVRVGNHFQSSFKRIDRSTGHNFTAEIV